MRRLDFSVFSTTIAELRRLRHAREPSRSAQCADPDSQAPDPLLAVPMHVSVFRRRTKSDSGGVDRAHALIEEVGVESHVCCAKLSLV
jgi:hypothetical protein